MTLFPANGEIKLDESTHKYILEGHKEIDFTSVTTCIAAFFETFNKNEVAHKLVTYVKKYMLWCVEIMSEDNLKQTDYIINISTLFIVLFCFFIPKVNAIVIVPKAPNIDVSSYVLLDAETGSIIAKLEELKIEPKNSEVQRIPLNTTQLPVEDAIKILNLIEKFEDDDDVQNVYHTLEVTDELIEKMEEE